ncbi:hypothetical protein PMG71_09625 [Roseofilum sp. BLCC_M154]|uniref:Uncharacterized protein n=1 Tax=Roseofilum acuticapitatum BLCC-M154 TaxID=3022444 RepID=A0ABT7AS26_9CYAN|nr:hypothetical protein [Roseofilum acuticapitatum]MDJ1169685.1 hypothetical protein [Roseofilum acuticapitatum BLCC-M154]
MANYNEQQIKKYRDQAIACLQDIEDEGHIESFYNAVDDLQRLQTYLDLSAKEYPIPPYPSK